MITAGIDIGAVSTKAVILTGANEIMASNVMATGVNSKKSVQNSLDKALEDAGLEFEDVNYILATGYGRFNIPFSSKQVTEISCHAKGAHFLFPGTKAVLDIGGQDCKAIRISEEGEAIDFIMNDKCAAGTGRFLEVMARVLGTKIEKLGELSLKAKNKKIEISSMCTVFAESEVISLIASGHPRDEITNGLHRAIVDRIISLANKIGIAESITLTGGVINNVGIVHILKEKFGTNINVPSNPQIVGALGAAIIARRYRY